MSDPAVDVLEGLEERLQSHAKAFESLLALTPAQDYYGSQVLDGRDPSEQWRAMKQTKEQKRAAKKAKLDPANQKSALDVMQERERKRKRELGMQDGDAGEGGEEPSEVKKGGGKRQKVENTEEEVEATRRATAEKKKEKREAKKTKAEKLKARKEAKKAAKQDQDLAEAEAEKQSPETAAQLENADGNSDDDGDAEPLSHPMDMDHVDMAGLADSEPPEGLAEAIANEDEASSVPTSPQIDSPAFDLATNHSAASSSSSIVPPPIGEDSQALPELTQQPPKSAARSAVAQPVASETTTKPKDPPSGTSSPKLYLPNIDQAALQERLRARIEELRARRKADGPEGKPAKSRQELLEQRRKKQEQRKAHKKELRRKAKEEEARKQEERLRGSGSPLSADIFSPRSPRPEQNNFSFSRLAFEDGTAANASLTGLQDARQKKGPQDPRGALLAVENKQKRVSGYDESKRADIAEKDLWLNAKKRAHGERVRDDTSLLKKALKRKEQQKNKSERAWKEREEGVRKGKEMRQKKREANLQKRKEEKGGGKGKKGGGKGKAAQKKKGRPGFEGRLKA